MGEVLRPREGERPLSEARTAPETPAFTPERQPLVAPDTHHAQPAGQALPAGQRPPCPRAGTTAAGSTRWGPRKPVDPTGRRGNENGPSVADRGAFSPPSQGGSLLASNERITNARPTDIERQL